MAAILFWLSVGFILYVYFGYPFLVFLLAKIFGGKASVKDMEQELPSLTLMIAAYNEADVIGRKIENSLGLTYPKEKYQILIVADGSSDETPDIVKSYGEQDVDLAFSPPRKGKMAAINRGMAFVNGEIVVFSDANNMFADDALLKLAANFADEGVGGVNGAKHILKEDGVLGESEGLYWRYESQIKKWECSFSSVTATTGEIFAVRKSLFEAPPADIINDDFYIAMRLIKHGFRVVYEPSAKSYERVSATMSDEVIRRTRIIAGRYQAMSRAGQLLPFRRPLLVWQIVSHKFMRPLVPWAMLSVLLTNVLVLILGQGNSGSGLWVWLLCGQILFYGVALLGQFISFGRILGKLLYIPTFLVSSNWAAMRGLYLYVRRQHTTLWDRVARRDDV